MSRKIKGRALIALLTVLLLGAGAALASQRGGKRAAPATPADEGELIVHEWGTFLSVQGSDGVTLGGMIESEEKLPRFVRERGLGGSNPLGFTSKMETPVTYFYVDRPRTVEVRVDMPKGRLTHWFPAVTSFGSLGCKKASAESGSYLDWGKVHLTPPAKGDESQLRPVAANDTWRFVRQTDAALVKVDKRPRIRPGGEWEKFLFYRGLGALDLPLEVRATQGVRCGQVSVRLNNNGSHRLEGVFVIKVEGDTIGFTKVADLPPSYKMCSRSSVALASPLPLGNGVPKAKKAVADALVKAGLYRKEAEAMVNNWEASYFRTPGLRVLYLVPRSIVDEIIPLHIKPQPQELVRVMVGRIEALTPQAERAIEGALVNLSSSNAKVRKAGETELASLGRLKGPVLRRLAEKAADAKARAKAAELVKAIR
jgi:hypothetical protein